MDLSSSNQPAQNALSVLQTTASEGKYSKTRIKKQCVLQHFDILQKGWGFILSADKKNRKNT